MVMEAVDAVPTPDVVGREFVRQYYTLLNQAPAHAHRFYNSNSYFVHGAMSKPAIGQRQIHQKIQQLNFRDCHAKISQVDSQATLGNGLVVQVSGELSNDGEPMRRFTQTFVLGTQSPKKYYVHNDIFRYQDMLLSDEEGDSPSEEDAEQPQDTQPDNPTTTNLEYFSSGTPGQVETPLAPASVPGQNVSLNGTTIHDESMQAGQTPLPPPQESTAPPVINGRVMPEELRIMGEEFIIGNQPNAQPELKSPKENKINRTAPSKPAEPEETGPTEHNTPQSENEPFPTEIIQEQLHISETSANEPKTYANLLKSDPLRMSSGVTSGSSTGGNRPTTNYNPQSGPAQRPDDGLQPPRPQRNQMRGVPSRGNNRGERTGGPSRSSFNEDGGLPSGGGSGENQDRRRNQPQYADSHQLFMGNLPLEASENDLREIFSKYGTIIDLRIHSKATSGAKGPPGSRVPNYGFITFENPQSVQEVLNDKPICFPKEGGVKLNVEEKKTKLRSSLPSQGGGGNGSSSSGGGGGGGGGGSSGGSESNWSAGRAPPRGGPSSRGPRGGGARGNFNRDSRGPPVNQRSNFTPRR